MEIPERLRNAFPPSHQRLLDVTRRRIDDEMLTEIAAADYGFDRDAHLAALRPIRDEGIVPVLLGWHPREVLELTRWSNPDNPAKPPFKPGSSGRRGHLIRTFACAALLQLEPAEATLVQCLVSAKVLEDEVSRAAGSFMTWQIPQIQEEVNADRWLWAFGLLVLATRTDPLADRMLGETAAWFLAEESAARAPGDASNPVPGPFGIVHGLWKPLAIELNDNLGTIKDSAARRELEFISAMLADEA